ncbi:MAG: flagellar hook-associated protein FlgL [Planctomycetota bacterium]|jgi:flagellin-like hook-associated protein FlgL|nr:flagellar hook-associated protein FlgL [Planctomycetota bacterium]
MRSTMQINANNTIRNLEKSKSRYDNIINQVALGKKVVKPSDDALVFTEGLRLSTVVSRLTQYNRNITNTGYSFLNLSEAALGSTTGGVSAALTRAKALVIQGASDTTTSSMRQANSLEISSILQEIVTVANRQEANRYLFGGTETMNPPYEIVGGSYVYYRGNEEAIKINVDASAAMQINVTGEQVFGSMNAKLATGDMSPRLNMNSAYSTPLKALNGGSGVPNGSINIKLGSLEMLGDSNPYPNGITIDLTGCVDIHDVKTRIEAETLAASQAAFEPQIAKLMASNKPGDKDAAAQMSFLATRYVAVELNPTGNGLSLRETDYVWEAVKDNQSRRPADYPGFVNGRYAALTVSEVAGGTVASSLGILGSVRYEVDPLNTQQAIPTAITGRDLDPVISKTTLLADLQNYDEKPFTITNGALPTSNEIIEVGDSANNFQNWYLNGLSQGQNTAYNGELYVRVEETETGSGQYRVNIYKNVKCTPEGMIATGEFKAGLVKLDEVNDSGVSGTVTMPPIASASGVAPIALQVNFPATFSTTISMSAYHAETVSESSHNVMADFRLTGMSPGGDPQNRAVEACDYNGNFSVEVVNNGTAAAPKITVNVYNAQNAPRSLIATGALENGLEQGIVNLKGVGNFDDLYGSTYIDWTRNMASATTQDAVNSLFAFIGDNPADQVNFARALVGDPTALPPTTGMTGNLADGAADAAIFIGALDALGYDDATYAKERQAMLDEFDQMTEAERKAVVARLQTVAALDPATATADEVNEAFDAVRTTFIQDEARIPYNMTATFATVEDLLNAVDQSNTYTTARIADNGKGVEIVSHLAGAYLMVTEQVKHATHYNDYGQLGDISLTSVLKGYNTDDAGKIYSNIVTDVEVDDAGEYVFATGVGLPASDMRIYTTTVKLYKDDPQTAAYDDEDSLVGFSKIQLAFNEADETWYQYEPVTAVWLEVKLPTTLNIDQTNHSGLTGTLELTGMRLPAAPATSTAYYDTTAAAGRKNLERAIVIDAANEQFNKSMSNGVGAAFSYLEDTQLKGVKVGVNTDSDGNILMTTGYQVSTNKDASQMANLQFKELTAADMDADGKLYGVASYATNKYTVADGTGEVDATIQQLQLSRISRNFEYTQISDTSKEGKIYAIFDGADLVFYSDPNGVEEVARAAGIAANAAATITPSPQPNPPGGTTTLTGSFKVGTTLPAVGDIIEIDLNRTSLALYSDAALNPADLVAIGAADKSGAVSLVNAAGDEIATANVPVASGKQHPTFDNSLVVNTLKQEVMLYAGDDFSRPVARGDITNNAGGEVKLTALNNSGLTGNLFLNAVVETTDRYGQVADMKLQGVTVGNTADNGALYMEIRQDTTTNPPKWIVDIYDNETGGALVASGEMNADNGTVTFADNGSGITGSMRLADPMRGWEPTAQPNGLTTERITIDASNQHSVMINQLNGLKNSGVQREDNLFATLNDALTNLNNNDVDALHNMLSQFATDQNRLLNAEATIGVWTSRLQMLELRHNDEIKSFTTSYSQSIAIDYVKAAVEMQNAENVYTAALKVYANINKMSLVDYI